MSGAVFIQRRGMNRDHRCAEQIQPVLVPDAPQESIPGAAGIGPVADTHQPLVAVPELLPSGNDLHVLRMVLQKRLPVIEYVPLIRRNVMQRQAQARGRPQTGYRPGNAWSAALPARPRCASEHTPRRCRRRTQVSELWFSSRARNCISKVAHLGKFLNCSGCTLLWAERIPCRPAPDCSRLIVEPTRRGPETNSPPAQQNLSTTALCALPPALSVL
jgi:hypothetical protein